MKADGSRKRRRYTIAEVEEILEAVEEEGVVVFGVRPDPDTWRRGSGPGR